MLPADARPARRRPSRAPIWALTLVDTAIVVLASAALVILLGGRTKLAFGHTHLLLFSPWRPGLWAAGLAVVRLWIGRGVPLFPSRRDDDRRAAIDAERLRFASPPPRPRAFAGYAGAAAVTSLLWLTPHVLHIRSIPDPGDPIFSAWRLARFAHQLAHDPGHLFDGNIFYPERWTLTYSDATILQGLVAAPVLLAGADPLIVSNALFLAAFPLCALAFFYAAWRMTGDLRAAFVAGVLGALSPFHTEHYSHLELQYFCFVPLALIAVLDVLAAPSVRRGAILGAIVCAQWLASMYFGVMLLTFLVPFAAIVAAAWRVRPTPALARAGLAAVLPIAVAFAAVGAPYLLSREARGDRSFALVRLSSALPSDYTRPHPRLASHDWRASTANQPERELFPGLSAPALALVGIVPPLGAVSAATLVSCTLALDWSFGANGLTYDDLYRWVLPYRGMRVAARFGAFVGSALTLLGAFGVARLLRLARTPLVERAVFLAIVVAVMIDLRPRIALRPYYRSIPSIYAAVGPQMVLAEFPFEPGVDQMYFSTRHWARLLNGYSGFFPGSFIRMARHAEVFPADSSLDALVAAGATHVTVNCALYGRACATVLAQLDESSRVRQVSSGMWEGADVRLYELVRPPSPADGRSR